MVDDAILCVCGLGKSLVIDEGLVQISRELREVVGANTKVGLYRWKHYKKILEDLQKWKPKRIYGAGHSYGCSTLNFVFEAVQLFRDVKVKHAIFCDPVYRAEVYRIDRDSLDSKRKLKIANNVEKLSTIEQDRTFITGHDCEVGPNTEYVHREVVDGKWWKPTDRHGFLDRHPRFHELVMEAILGS